MEETVAVPGKKRKEQIQNLVDNLALLHIINSSLRFLGVITETKFDILKGVANNLGDSNPDYFLWSTTLTLSSPGCITKWHPDWMIIWLNLNICTSLSKIFPYWLIPNFDQREVNYINMSFLINFKLQQIFFLKQNEQFLLLCNPPKTDTSWVYTAFSQLTQKILTTDTFH